MHNGTNKRLQKKNARLISEGKKRNEHIEKGKKLVKKKVAQLKDGLKVTDARCQQKIESIHVQSQQMVDVKEEQCMVQLMDRVKKMYTKKLEKKEEQCERKMGGHVSDWGGVLVSTIDTMNGKERG